MTVFSAHGVAPAVHENARARRLQTIDATCPLVTKVHVEARRFAAAGYTIVLVGHDGHEEVEGTMGEAPDADRARADRAGRRSARRSRIPSTSPSSRRPRCRSMRRAASSSALRERFPAIVGPRTDDICYATTNRQAAVRKLAHECDVVLVDRLAQLVQLAAPGRGRQRPRRPRAPDRQRLGTRGVLARGRPHGRHLLRRERAREPRAGAVTLFRERGVSDVSEVQVTREDVRFMLPEDDPGRGAHALASTRAHAGRLRPAPRDAGGRRCAAPRPGARRVHRRARRHRSPGPARRHPRVAPTQRPRGPRQRRAGAAEDRRAPRRAVRCCSSPATTTTR